MPARGYKKVFMLISLEHEIFSANKYKRNANFSEILCLAELSMKKTFYNLGA